ncbi:HAD-IA family hydrolase [Nitratireductor sp. XY-223]|uniref:HAD-IA family hydrolase n=1 Tax=Nitratireductor sp. XY-223 TaxID=2561926 RepID=UPI0010AABF80|nr:HAD-IA family hydrolase [Nitratireductor sp. XY-223]
MPVRALIFDVDGTLAETEDLHRLAFNRAFEIAGIDWVWSRDLYARLLRVTGGRERIRFYADETGAADIDSAALHRTKTEIYNGFMSPGVLELRPGIERLIRRARDGGLKLAIATTTSRANIDSLFGATMGKGALDWFASIRSGEDVRNKKPDPEVFELVLADLDLPPEDCIVFEDSENGLRAAKALSLPTVVTPSIYTWDNQFSAADLVVRTVDEPFSMRELMPEKELSDIPESLRDLLFAQMV